MATVRAESFSDRLLAWWDIHGRKDLPWQSDRTAYRVWISEIMLQQTQVSTVIPYFQRWMEDFPDLCALASASQDDVLGHWAGLGYYARARNLHKTAQICRDEFAGELPATAEALAALPGIGLSTANAIVSQSTDQPAAILDGNVRRVLARHAAVEGWAGKAAVQKQLWKESEQRLPIRRGANYTQAIMDLGATLCTRSNPACDRCPVATDCQALQQDSVSRFPQPKPATKVKEMTLELAIVRDPQGRMLLQKRPASGIWGGLWCLPDPGHLGVEIESAERLPTITHRLSHRLMTLKPLRVQSTRASRVECPGDSRWFGPKELAGLGLPKPIAKLLQDLHHGELE